MVKRLNRKLKIDDVGYLMILVPAFLFLVAMLLIAFYNLFMTKDIRLIVTVLEISAGIIIYGCVAAWLISKG